MVENRVCPGLSLFFSLIPESFKQDLLVRVDIVDVVSRYVQLKRAGANHLGLCPFHNEKTPSFTVSNAKQVLAVQKEFGSLAALLWSFVEGRPIQNRWKDLAELPTETSESRRMSRELKRRRFRFVGPTICYAFMEAVGMVNDHETGCFRHEQISALGIG